MQIQGTSHVHGSQNISGPHFAGRTQGSQAATGTRQAADRVEISAAAQEALKATETGDVRQDLVNNIRSQIANGTYETPEKLDVAMERLLDQIG
jgi:negative regulator of flagellin synthesis FlgM